jgi:hypothetical protein
MDAHETHPSRQEDRQDQALAEAWLRRPPSVVSREVRQRADWLGWRQANVNASEAACLWSDAAHPYLTAYKLWAMRSGRLDDQADSKALKRGRLLEDDAIELVQEERPHWQIWRPAIYLSQPDWRIGATPDAYAIDWNKASPNHSAPGVIQIKTVGRWAFERYWRDQDTREIVIPLWIAIQAAIEAILSGFHWAAVGVMVISDGGELDIHVNDIPIKPEIMTSLQPKVADFWRRVHEVDPYPIDFGRDLETVFDVYREDDGSQIDLTGDPEIVELLGARDGLKAVEKDGDDAKKARRGIDARIIVKMGNANRAAYGDRMITAMNVKKRPYTVQAQNYRFVRVSEGKRR